MAVEVFKTNTIKRTFAGPENLPSTLPNARLEKKLPEVLLGPANKCSVRIFAYLKVKIKTQDTSYEAIHVSLFVQYSL